MPRPLPRRSPRAGLAAEDVFYCAESVLQERYRGQGVGHRFFDLREAHARALGFSWSVFCAVIRPQQHPLRPAGYRPLDPFWRRRGYAPLTGCVGGILLDRCRRCGRNGEAAAAVGAQVVIPPRDVRLAAAAYPVEALTDLAAVEAKLTAWVADAAGQGADLLVFPEYAGMEAALTADRPQPVPRTIGAPPRRPRRDWYHAVTCRGWRSNYGVHILAGSLPVWEGGRLLNRALLIAPDRATGRRQADPDAVGARAIRRFRRPSAPLAVRHGDSAVSAC